MATDNSQTAQPARKSSTLLVALIVLLFLLATGAAVGGTWLYMSSGHTSKVTKKKTPEEPVKPVYVAIEPFTANLNNGDGRVLYVKLSLKVADNEVEDRLQEHMPQVRNRILMVLTTQRADVLTTLKGKKALADSIQAALIKPFNEDAKPLDISDVLFTDFIVQ